jgi:AcrR family transcriptional regulator
MSHNAKPKPTATRASPERPEVRARTRARLLDAARDIVAESGVDAITMRGLGERAGVSVQSAYNLFGNKELLVTALVEEELTRLDAEFAAVADDDDPLEQLRTQYALFVDSAMSHTRKPLTLAVLNDAVLTEQVFGSWRSHTVMEDGIRRAIKAGQVGDEISPSALAEHIRGGLIHVLRLWAAGLISDGELRHQAVFTLDVALLAIAKRHVRGRLLRLVKEHTTDGR